MSVDVAEVHSLCPGLLHPSDMSRAVPQTMSGAVLKHSTAFAEGCWRRLCGYSQDLRVESEGRNLAHAEE